MEEKTRIRIHDALDVEHPDPTLRRRVLSSLPVDDRDDEPHRRPAFQIAGGVIAAVLAVTVIATMLYFGGRLGQHSQPASGSSLQLTVTSALGFKCTLPVTAYLTYAEVSIPDGRAEVHVAPSATPGTKAYSLATWDAAAGRFVPVPRQALSPDGKEYAYLATTSGVPGQMPTLALHVVTIGSGRDRQLWTGSGGGGGPVTGWVGSTIYFAKSQENGPGMELWALDTTSGSARRVGPNPPPPAPKPGEVMSGPPIGYVQQVNSLGGWSVTSDRPSTGPKPGDTSFTPVYPDQLQRMDLRDGTLASWFTNPTGGYVQLLGFDAAGHPIIRAGLEAPKPVTVAPSGGYSYGGNPFQQPARVLVVTGPGSVTPIADGSNPSFSPISAAGDSHGIWFGEPGSIWFFDRGGLRKFADAPAGAFPMPTAPPGAPTPPPGSMPSPPPGYPTGSPVTIVGGCA
ncbi:MAG TPA: hypothetical protein VF137_03285 [Candidatus Dormibacteraeota bacterium]